MRSAGNFSPEWGYLAPAPSFMRTARVVLVATAIGATAGAGVVLSLVDRPASEANGTSVAAHAIVTSVQAAPIAAAPTANAAAVAAAPINVTTAGPPPVQAPPSAPVALPVAPPPPVIATETPAIVPPQPAARTAPAESRSEQGAVAAPKPAPGIAALSETPAASEATPVEMRDETLLPPETVPPERKPRNHAAAYPPKGKEKPPATLATVLRRLFSAHNTGTTYYPNR